MLRLLPCTLYSHRFHIFNYKTSKPNPNGRYFLMDLQPPTVTQPTLHDPTTKIPSVEAYVAIV